MRTWIAVCDASRARFFMTREGSEEWVKFEEFEHPASRARDIELNTDEHGTYAQRGGRQSNVGPENHGLTAHETEELRFAHYVGDTLNSAHAQNAFDRLVLVAPPKFLGLLRAELNDRVRKTVYATLDRDYSRLAEADLQERITLP